MILTCPACSTRYSVDDTLGDRPRRVRCVKCAHEWVFDPAEALAEATATPEESAELAAESPAVLDEPEPVQARAAQSALPSVATAADAGAGGAIYLTRRRRRFDLIVSAVVALVILAAILAGLWNYRVPIVRAVPSLGGLYSLVGIDVNAVGMEIRDTKWQIKDQGGEPVLVVTGEVVNISKQSRQVPHLSLVLRNSDQHELYHWTLALERKELGSGETAEFSTTLKSPPLEAHDVEIRFAPGQ